MTFTSNRHLYFDFGAPSFFSDMVIYSKKNTAETAKANFLQGIFDLPTFIMIGASFVSVAWMLGHDFDLSLSEAFSRASGIAFNSGYLLFCLEATSKLCPRY